MNYTLRSADELKRSPSVPSNCHPIKSTVTYVLEFHMPRAINESSFDVIRRPPELEQEE